MIAHSRSSRILPLSPAIALLSVLAISALSVAQPASPDTSASSVWTSALTEFNAARESKVDNPARAQAAFARAQSLFERTLAQGPMSASDESRVLANLAEAAEASGDLGTAAWARARGQWLTPLTWSDSSADGSVGNAISTSAPSSDSPSATPSSAASFSTERTSLGLTTVERALLATDARWLLAALVGLNAILWLMLFRRFALARSSHPASWLAVLVPMCLTIAAMLGQSSLRETLPNAVIISMPVSPAAPASSSPSPATSPTSATPTTPTKSSAGLHTGSLVRINDNGDLIGPAHRVAVRSWPLASTPGEAPSNEPLVELSSLQLRRIDRPLPTALPTPK